MKEVKFKAYDPRVDTWYPYVKLTWNGGIEARLDPEDHNSIKDITIFHANGEHEDYLGEIRVYQYVSGEGENEKYEEVSA